MLLHIVLAIDYHRLIELFLGLQLMGGECLQLRCSGRCLQLLLRRLLLDCRVLHSVALEELLYLDLGNFFGLLSAALISLLALHLALIRHSVNVVPKFRVSRDSR